MGCMCSKDSLDVKEVKMRDPVVTVGNMNVVTQGKKNTTEEAECEICSADEGRRFHCPVGHVICQSCFRNQVEAWCDPATGGCNDTEVPLQLAFRGNAAVATNPRTPDQVKKGLQYVGWIPCSHEGCKNFVLPKQVVPALGNPVQVGVYERGCRHQREKLQQKASSLEQKFGRRLGGENRRAHHLIPTTSSTAGGQLRDEAPTLPLSSRERSEREIFVEEQLLTLHCPKCDMAILDFNNCFAVQCSGCNHWFCAWCLDFSTKSNAEAHTHVGQCPQNPLPDKSVWGTLEQFHEHHLKKKTEACGDFIKGQHDPSLNRRLRPVLKSTLGSQGWNNIKRELPEEELPICSPLLAVPKGSTRDISKYQVSIPSSPVGAKPNSKKTSPVKPQRLRERPRFTQAHAQQQPFHHRPLLVGDQRRGFYHHAGPLRALQIPRPEPLQLQHHVDPVAALPPPTTTLATRPHQTRSRGNSTSSNQSSAGGDFTHEGARQVARFQEQRSGFQQHGGGLPALRGRFPEEDYEYGARRRPQQENYPRLRPSDPRSDDL